jgi:hypothetical protein
MSSPIKAGHTPEVVMLMIDRKVVAEVAAAFQEGSDAIKHDRHEDGDGGDGRRGLLRSRKHKEKDVPSEAEVERALDGRAPRKEGTMTWRTVVGLIGIAAFWVAVVVYVLAVSAA